VSRLGECQIRTVISYSNILNDPILLEMGQNCGLILSIADDNFLSPTFPHYYGRNDEVADRSIAGEPAISSDGAIFVPGRHIRYYALDGDSLGH
jgi:hypothetical protein